ncbi:hypothetical protein Tcan_13500 [Toxocara canis]|nr:hypothetical protein Tcan_13500 [Toxocara canis]
MSAYAPPTVWTYPIFGEPSYGQSRTAAAAEGEIKRDIEDSVTQALAEMNLDSAGLLTHDIKPLGGTVLTKAPPAGLTDPKWYLTRTGTVFFECIQALDGKSNCEPLQLGNTITIVTRYPLSEQQKKKLAELLANQLTNKNLFLPNQVTPD